MYVNERTGYDVLTDPNAGEFGGFGSFADPSDTSTVSMGTGDDVGAGTGLDQLGDLLAQAGVSPMTLAASLGACLLSGDRAACAWRALKSIIMRHPQASLIIETILTTDCATALTSLGLPSEVVLAACALGGGVWSDIQAKAAAELGVATGSTTPSRQEQYEADYARGRDRTEAEGGGHTLVNTEGSERNVWCPGYVRQVVRDAAGNVAAYVIEPSNIYAPGSRCPQDVAGVVRREGVTPVAVPGGGEASTAKRRGPMTTIVRPRVGTKSVTFLTSKSGTPDTVRPWYKRKWVWISAGVVVTLGVAGYAWSRRGA